MASRSSALKRDITVEHATEAWFRDGVTGKLVQLPIAALPIAPSISVEADDDEEDDMANVVAIWALGRRRS